MSAARSNIFSLFQLKPKPEPPAQVISTTFNQRPTQGHDLDVSWKTRNSIKTHLDIEQGDLVLFSGIVPHKGSVKVHVHTPEDIEIELTVDNHAGTTETNKWQITPKATPPKFRRIRLPAKIWLGETILASWRARRATGVGVEVETADGTQQRIGKPIDAFLLTPSKPGWVIFRFFLKGQHTTIFDTRVVHVVARKPYITME